MSGSGGQATRVKIYGQYYDLLGDDPQWIRTLAALVDERMTEVARQTPTVDTMKVAILAALSLADELLEARTDRAGPETELEGRIGGLCDQVREVLSSLSPGEDKF